MHARGDDLDDVLETLAQAARPGCPATRVPTRPRPAAWSTALRGIDRRTETTNIVAVDQQGNGCVITTSLGLGSGVWVPGFGVHLNSMIGEGELIRGLMHVPGSRMGSMMSPLVALDAITAGRRVAGAAGGSRIRPALMQCVLRMLNGEDPQAAIDAAAAERPARPGPARAGLLRRGARGAAGRRRAGRRWRTSWTPTSAGCRRSARSAAAPTRGAAAVVIMLAELRARRPGPHCIGSRVIPSSTYRLQIQRDVHPGRRGRRRGYLRELGVGAIYLSPVLQSTSGSDARLRHRRPQPDRPGPRRRGGLAAAARRRPGTHGSGRRGRHRAQSPGDLPPRARTRPGGTCCSTGRSRRTRTGSTSTGPRRIVLPVLGDDAVARAASTGSCGTSSTASRWLPGRGPRVTTPSRRARPPALRAACTTPAATAS